MCGDGSFSHGCSLVLTLLKCLCLLRVIRLARQRRREAEAGSKEEAGIEEEAGRELGDAGAWRQEAGAGSSELGA